MAATNRPASLTVKDLSAAIERAMEDVAKDHGLEFGSEIVLGPGTIIGRWLREGIDDISAIEDASTKIGSQVQEVEAIRAHAPAISPAFMWHGGHIIMGIVYEPRTLAR